MQKLHSLVLIVAACNIAGETFAADIDAAIAAHKEATTTARDIVAVGYQKLMLEAIEKNDIEQSLRLRKYAELFEVEDALYLVPDLKPTLKEYFEKKSAADEALRQVYVAAMKAAIDAGDLAESERLVAELGDHKLPASPVSYKVAGMNAYLGHANYQLVGDYPGDEGKKFHATWEELSGLSGPAHVSLRPINWPNRYVDHYGFRVRLASYQENHSWKQHATWVKLPGFANPNTGVSFRSVSHPDRYIRVRDDGEVWIDTYENTQQFRDQATFYKQDPLFHLR